MNVTRPVSLALGFLLLTSSALAQTPAPNWTQFNPTTKPLGRQNSALAYDANRQRMVMFGGWTNNTTPGSRLSDTWEWNGKDWTLVNTTTSPTPRDGHAMAYDSKRGVTVLTAGYVSGSDTWEYDGTNWSQITTVTQHSLGAHSGMAFDSDRNVMVLFAAPMATPQTWEYDGKDWKQITTANSPISGTNLAYDSLRKKTVLVRNNQTWEYDGRDWTQINTTTLPTARGGAAFGLVYDEARNVVVMFGGSGAAMGDVWEYNGVDWVQVKTAAAPTNPRRYVAMGYDSDRKRTVLFGGRDFSLPQSTTVGDTWEYAGGACFLSVDVFSISLRSGGKQQLTVDAGAANGNKLYWIFGSLTGTTPGISLGGFHIPLMPDAYTDIALAAANSAVFAKFNGVLDLSGKATATLNVPPVAGPQINLFHACVVHTGPWVCTSNATVVSLK